MGKGLAAAVGLVVMLTVAGCGGDDSSSSEPSISKAQFIVEVDAICKRGNKRMETAFIDFLEENRDIKRPSGPQYEELVGEIMVPSITQEIEEIKELGAPSGDEDDVEAFVGALEEGLETAEDNPKAVTSSSDAIFGIASRLGGEYGLKVCGAR